MFLTLNSSLMTDTLRK